MDEAREYELSLLSSTTQSTEGAAEPNDENRVLTFAELKELIETGNVDKIPNNKIIPERLNVRHLFLFLTSILLKHVFRTQCLANQQLLQERSHGKQRWLQSLEEASSFRTTCFQVSEGVVQYESSAINLFIIYQRRTS